MSTGQAQSMQVAYAIVFVSDMKRSVVPFAGKLRYTRVFVRREGHWQAVAMQHTMIQ